jgi:hypothetical protein
MDVVQSAVRQFFMTMGVDLNPPKNIFFNDREGTLIVRATMEDLDIIEAAVQVLNIAPPQVNIKAKFVEVSQSDNRALGFDWYLGNVLMNGGSMGSPAAPLPPMAAALQANPQRLLPGHLLGDYSAFFGFRPGGHQRSAQRDQRARSGDLHRHSDRSAIPRRAPRARTARRRGSAERSFCDDPERTPNPNPGRRHADHCHRHIDISQTGGGGGRYRWNGRQAAPARWFNNRLPDRTLPFGPYARRHSLRPRMVTPSK